MRLARIINLHFENIHQQSGLTINKIKIMAFYQDIVSAYDEIFPLNKMQVSFIERVYPAFTGKYFLDAGCGTGSLAIDLGRKGAGVKAFDLDEDMILRAVKKCPQALNVKFIKGDLLTIGQDYSGFNFDMVYCFGNTLVHLANAHDINQFIGSVSKLLKPGGRLLLQIVNYDRILENHIQSLPTIESENYRFERYYSFREDGAIDFSTTLKALQSDDVSKQTVRLLLLKKDELFNLLSPYFSNVNFYGSFKGEAWSNESFHTIVEAW
jgi:2-polyprenyl-3-methyl-5-hydroxy-6-metoxy-1,4-benzoquinol methylase